MQSPLVSIITISRNSERHIEQTIASVAGQDYPNIEHIVVDGSSTDGTLGILMKYSGGIVRWVSEPDRGPGDAIKKGLKMATGEVIALLNSDDYYADTTVVRKVMVAFERSADIRMVYGMVRCIEEESGDTIMLWGRDREPSDIRRKMCLPTPSVFSRRELWDEVGPYSDEYEYADDYEWAIRALKVTRPYFLDHVVACMRSNGRSHRNYRQGLAEMARALKEHGYHTDYVRVTLRNRVRIVLRELGLMGFIYKIRMSMSSKGL